MLDMRLLFTTSLLSAALAIVACGDAPRIEGVDGSDPERSADGTIPGFGEGDGHDGADGGSRVVPAKDCAPNKSGGDPNKDYDGDGFPLKDDCNECDPGTNAGAYDVAGDGIDQDCNGKVDDESSACDDGLGLDGADAFDGARAIGLCKRATDDKMWGVLKAEWLKPDGTPQPIALSQGILAKLGVNTPKAGKRMLAISSGSARDPSDPGYRDVQGWSKGGAGAHGTPSGYPKSATTCLLGFGDFGPAFDGAALKVTVRVPTNAQSFSYQQNFFTYEFPEYTCSFYNDFFVAMMEPKVPSLPDGNIAFDQDKNPISVNASFLQVCKPQLAGFKPFKCPLGESTLAGTGFQGHAATGWLTTTAPVDTIRGKQMTLMFAIWDQGDGALDSTALVDDFAWSPAPAAAPETKPTPVK